MVSDINSRINNIQQGIFDSSIPRQQTPKSDMYNPSDSFIDEDQAIISSEAMLQNELEKFNSGGDNFVELAAACVLSKITVEANVNVINAKKDAMDAVLEIGK